MAGALKLNLLLTLAEAEFFRLRWSERVLDETQNAIGRIFAERGSAESSVRAVRARRVMKTAFEDAMVSDFDSFLRVCTHRPDPNDAHVLAAALKTKAVMIVTENLEDFPEAILAPLTIEARSADAFLADAIDLDPGRAVAAIRRVRERLKKP